jgi:phenylacetate-coenzyme A ligase PaaK-like adenylate-forming protein
MELRRFKNTDSFANLFPLTVYPYGGFHRTIVASYAMKIPVVSPIPGRPSEYFKLTSTSEEVVRILERTRPTILWGVPSYVRRLLIQAEEMDADLSAARLILVTGEPCTDAMRADLIRRLSGRGATDPQVLISYGSTEMQGGSIECAPYSGFHNPMPEDFYFEVVDPETHSPLPDGEAGLVVLTHLNRRGTVLLRYSLGDLSIKTSEQCPHCGAWGERFTESPSRADNLVKIRGMLVNPDEVSEILIADPGIAEYQLRIGRENPDDALSMDRLTIRVAASGKLGQRFEDDLVEKVKAAIHVTPRIEWVSKDEIYDPETSMKSKRLVDERR